MSVLKAYFDKNVNQESRVCPDFVRKVNYDKNGREIITYEEFDSAKYQESLGTVNDWSLSALLKAGIDPDFHISTGLVSRLEGIDTVNSAVETLNSILESESNVESPKE